jgi:isopentenyl diphosphate isomerase/L-lactate dehydrogenase-like FMN-dependent dehydrogenase
MNDRRAFLKFLASSPLFACLPSIGQALAQATSLQTVDSLIGSAAEALDVFDFEAVARKSIPPAHWGYMATGVDGEDTLRANREAFSRYQLRTRRFVDVSKMDMSVELFGTKFSSPILLCPVGGQKAFYLQGETAVARAAKARNHLQILSTVTSSSVEEVIEARGGPIWYQLYTTNSFDITTRLVKRAQAAGCPVVAVTVDLPAGRNTETNIRMARIDTRNCTSCHGPTGSGPSARPMFRGVDMAGITTNSASLTWDFIKRLKDVTTMKVLIKGLETREDAALAIEHGADGIIVSNHGGRATETNRATLDALPEVVQEVRGRIPVLIDGGFRRGTDVFKALALGATAVGIGRPYIWGLGAFGQPGVDRVLEILNNELRLAMVGCGARSLREITSSLVMKRS